MGFWWYSGPDCNIYVEMSSVHREKVEGGQTKQGGRRHEVEVGVVGQSQVPDHRQGETQEGDKKCRHIEGLPMVVVDLMMVAMGRPLIVMVVVISNPWSDWRLLLCTSST